MGGLIVTTRKQFIEKVKELGCTFEEDEAGFCKCITVDTPMGFKFNANGGHCIVERFQVGYTDKYSDKFKPECYSYLIECLKMGLCPCEDPECDICHPEED